MDAKRTTTGGTGTEARLQRLDVAPEKNFRCCVERKARDEALKVDGMARAEERAEESERRLGMTVEDLEIRGALAREKLACEAAMKSAITFEGRHCG